MAMTKLAASMLVLAFVASAHAQGTYWSEAKPPTANAILSSANELLCTYLNVNCPNNGIFFQTPPAPAPPPFVPQAAPAPQPTASSSQPSSAPQPASAPVPAAASTPVSVPPIVVVVSPSPGSGPTTAVPPTSTAVPPTVAQSPGSAIPAPAPSRRLLRA